jgi:hypothetical protein
VFCRLVDQSDLILNFGRSGCFQVSFDNNIFISAGMSSRTSTSCAPAVLARYQVRLKKALPPLNITIVVFQTHSRRLILAKGRSHNQIYKLAQPRGGAYVPRRVLSDHLKKTQGYARKHSNGATAGCIDFERVIENRDLSTLCVPPQADGTASATIARTPGAI